jgi:hypothetical protein
MTWRKMKVYLERGRSAYKKRSLEIRLYLYDYEENLSYESANDIKRRGKDCAYIRDYRASTEASDTAEQQHLYMRFTLKLSWTGYQLARNNEWRTEFELSDWFEQHWWRWKDIEGTRGPT